MSFDRFDFEQQIMNCWNVTTDLKDLTEEVIEGNLSKDQISNVLMGLEQLYQIRFDKLFRMFEQGLKEGAFEITKTEDEVQDPKSLLREFVHQFDHEHLNQTNVSNVLDQLDENARAAGAVPGDVLGLMPSKKNLEQPYTLSPEAMDEITVTNLREYRKSLGDELVKNSHRQQLCAPLGGEELRQYNEFKEEDVRILDTIAALDLVLSKFGV
jgi:hypothetical protein